MNSGNIPPINKKNIFVFSGLGVDKSVFDHINFGNHHIVFIDWIPARKNETIADYASRIATKITAKNPIIIGLSFGGMIAVEIAKIRALDQLILLATAKTKYEIPNVYRLMGILPLHHLVPIGLFKQSNPLTNWLFGIESRSDSAYLKKILADTDLNFLKWAIDAIVHWKNSEVPQQFVHIHGAKDRILPLKNIEVDYIIQDAGHFMTVNRFNEINTLFEKILNKHD